MKLIFPEPLFPGDTLGIVAPASAPPESKNVDRAIAELEKLGFKIKIAPHAHKRLGYLAGNDRDRAADLMRMFMDKSVNAIICVRGGYGTARLLTRLDYKKIRQHAKIFVGYSDITSLHCAFLTHAGMVSFHGPMLNSEFAERDLPEFTLRSFLTTLAGRPAEHIAVGYEENTVKTLRSGKARGTLIGGNLALLCTVIGTPWQPSFKNNILFLEDIGEAPYRWDRMLTYLLNCGLLQQVSGIAIGLNADCEDPRAKKAKEYRQTLEEVLKERLLPLKVPLVIGLPFGHVLSNATLPVGVRATLDANRGQLRLEQSGIAT